MREPTHKSRIPYWRRNSSLHFGVGLILSLTLVTMAFEWNFPDKLTDTPLELKPGTDPDEPDMKAVLMPVPPRPKVPVNVVEVPDDSHLSSKALKEPVEEPFELSDAPVPSLDELIGNNPPVDDEPDEAVYQLIPAEPEGGMNAFYQYLYTNINYPDYLKERNMSGKIFVEFEISESGKISNVKILKGFDKNLEKEIIRLLKEAPAWVPAVQGNQKVRTIHRIPFTFDLK